MSLINKMLRDLDARGGGDARGDASSLVRPVGRGSRGGLPPFVIGAGVAVFIALGAGGFVAWKYWRGTQPVGAPAAAVAVARTPQAAPAQPVVQKNGPVAVAASDEGPAVVPGDIPPDVHRAAGEKMAREMEERNAAARRAAAAGGADAAAGAARGPRSDNATANEANAGGSPKRVAAGRAFTGNAIGGGTPVAPRARGSKAPAGGPVGSSAATASGAAAAGGAGTGAMDASLSPQQKAENEYRRALLKLQDARVSEAFAGLERALELYPRHEAARQTLVSLLLESGRNAEAIHHLALATSLDPRQGSMAMLLARLQLENGGNALETLQRSLPYAESNAEYRALIAGILQRASRHKEAVEHYQAAVRLQPDNSVWWMGLGISLQADKRNAEAKTAFRRAGESGRLAPELQAFVERRLQQLD